jgi:hypothetical protein
MRMPGRAVSDLVLALCPLSESHGTRSAAHRGRASAGPGVVRRRPTPKARAAASGLKCAAADPSIGPDRGGALPSAAKAASGSDHCVRPHRSRELRTSRATIGFLQQPARCSRLHLFSAGPRSGLNPRCTPPEPSSSDPGDGRGTTTGITSSTGQISRDLTALCQPPVCSRSGSTSAGVLTDFAFPVEPRTGSFGTAGVAIG